MKDIFTLIKKNRVFILLLLIYTLVSYLLLFFSSRKWIQITEIIVILMILTIAAIYYTILEYRIMNEMIRASGKMVRGNYLKIPKKKNTAHSEIVKNLNLISTRVENLEKQKDSFIYDVSHELRTPISTMKILSESMQYSASENITTYKEFFSDIVNELDRMNEIITDLMESVNLEPSNYIIKLKPIYLNYLCETVIKHMKPLSQNKNIELKFIEDADLQILIDFSKMERVLSNLIENSIKYSEEKSTIIIRLFKSGDFACISVEDQGIGIPKSDLGQIFERFYRVDKDRSRSTGGTGLGLYITKNIIDMHEGEILVDSTENKGSKFTIRLPIK